MARTSLPGDPAVETISVNGVRISSQAIAAEAQNHPDPDPDGAYFAAARALVVRELLKQEAEKLEISAVPMEIAPGKHEDIEEARYRVLLEREIKTPTPDEESCRRFYHANLSRFRGADIFEPAHILFTASPDDPEAYRKAEEDASRCLDILRDDPGEFSRLARAQSACPSGKDGGVLGQITHGDTAPEFEKALLSLEAGELYPEPLKSRFGVHVLRLERKDEGKTLPFDAVRERIASYLSEASWRRGAAQYVQVLAAKADIRGLDFGDLDSVLVR
ncbi:peptidylprolyl isomerase [Varunaivibrio sulfuroxidans]|uniref:Parvulin-like PPIase n=1 Tax=Varunaivibrio sulfuroxidans TaxID=1773489 RepID=A0A4R3JAC9_9PROT|nr:peptidylprolyl isomerase [Varunaivibrio sulfuroxidans]TCS62929.1 peptidyl-prolyl cis-trans isomerase C [Varunaivibrio sulfuroxidans]WES31995.1 peptidylprolyl isomerase [Varunaivibrio sulfuroxidans]